MLMLGWKAGRHPEVYSRVILSKKLHYYNGVLKRGVVRLGTCGST